MSVRKSTGQTHRSVPTFVGGKSRNSSSGVGSLKDSLKSKILHRRQNQGLGQISLDFSPKSPQPLTEYERKKETRRKESNRRSANRCRERAKKEKEINAKNLQEEQSRRNELLHREKTLVEQKDLLLQKLTELGVSEQEISQTLAAIVCENKTLQSANNSQNEDFESVLYLKQSEQDLSQTSPETSFSYSSDTSDDVIQNGVCESLMSMADEFEEQNDVIQNSVGESFIPENEDVLGKECDIQNNAYGIPTLISDIDDVNLPHAREDIMTGHDVTNDAWRVGVPEYSDVHYEIMDANQTDLSQIPESEIVTVIISYGDTQDDNVYGEQTYTNL